MTLKYKDVTEFNNIFLKDKITENMKRVEFSGFTCIGESIVNMNRTIEDIGYAFFQNNFPRD